jgi:hypothetical protein
MTSLMIRTLEISLSYTHNDDIAFPSMYIYHIVRRHIAEDRSLNSQRQLLEFHTFRVECLSPCPRVQFRPH